MLFQLRSVFCFIIANIQQKMSKLLKQRKELIENNNDLQKQMDNLLKENEEMKKTSILMLKSSTCQKTLKN